MIAGRYMTAPRVMNKIIGAWDLVRLPSAALLFFAHLGALSFS